MIQRERDGQAKERDGGFGQLQILQTSELQQASETLQATKQNPSDAALYRQHGLRKMPANLLLLFLLLVMAYGGKKTK